MRAKPRLFEALDTRFGSRRPSNATPANYGFHVLEHPETLWLKKFTSYLCEHLSIASLIWLHDGTWLSPQPSLEVVTAANRHASAHIGLSSSPLEYRLTSCRSSYVNVLTPLLHGGTLPPLSPPLPPFTPPLLSSSPRNLSLV